MAKLLGNKIGEEVCKVLGLDSKNIQRVSIILAAGDAAKIEIIRILDTPEKDSILQIVEHYEVTKVKDAN